MMIYYHPIKFGCKKISISVDMVETVISDYMSPHCDPEFEDSKPDLELEENKPIFLYDMMMHHHTNFP